mgnify:CR=1 FL=1
MVCDPLGFEIVDCVFTRREQDVRGVVGQDSVYLFGHVAIEDAKIAILGLTYRPGVKEIRASPAISISQELSELNAEVFGIDPLLDSFEEFDLQPIEQDTLYEVSVDGLILVTPHEEFERIRWTELDDPAVIIDGRASLEDLETDSWIYTIGSGK